MRDRKKVHNDFIAWSDQELDLDDLLGEYTATDDDWETDHSSDNDDLVANVADTSSSGSSCDSGEENNPPLAPPPPPKKKKTTTSQPAPRPLYQCPVCDKVLKTIPGFRGHMQRIHEYTNVKASNHRVAASSQPSAKSTPQKATPSASWTIPDMEAVVLQTLLQLEQSKVYNRPSSRGGHFIVEIASQLSTFGSSSVSSLSRHFSQLVSVLGTGTTMQLDRERMFASFHQMCLNPELLDLLTAEITTAVPDHLQCHIWCFIQVFLDALLETVIDVRTTKATEHNEANTAPVNAHDQGVLMYISGFLVSAQMKRYRKSPNRKAHLAATKNLVSSSSSPQYLAQHHEWIKKCDRGGLKLPCDDFFLMVRQMEAVTRANTDLTSLEPGSLLMDKLQDAILEDFMVSHYWGQLMSGVCHSVSIRLLNDILVLFLRVRGHAVEKLTRRAMQLSVKKKKITSRQKSLSHKKWSADPTVQKKSMSLRRSLKK